MTNNRVQSLDILRGADLCLLLVIGPLLRSFASCGGYLSEGFQAQLGHVEWEGFALWDIIMPLFLFMSGVAIPFAVEKYTTERHFWLRMLRRFLLLFVFGAVLQGNLLSLDPRQLHWFSNTLQSIAVGYLFTAIMYHYRFPKWALWSTLAALLGLFSILLLTGGDFTADGNFCERVERAVMGSTRDQVWYDEAGQWHFSDSYHYTWIVSSLGFIATVLLGALAGGIIKEKRSHRDVFFRLLIIGVVLTVGGWIWGQNGMPVIKKLWTPSMVLFAGGISFLLMSLFYALTDWLPGDKWLGWLKIFGTNSIVAYMMINLTSRWFIEFFDHIFFGFEQFTGSFYPLFLNLITRGFFVLILVYMYRRRIFLKV